jgi:hypothetical protein
MADKFLHEMGFIPIQLCWEEMFHCLSTWGSVMVADMLAGVYKGYKRLVDILQ